MELKVSTFLRRMRLGPVLILNGIERGLPEFFCTISSYTLILNGIESSSPRSEPLPEGHVNPQWN